MSDEAELAVLGSVLVSGGDVLDDLSLTGDDFRDPKRGDLFDLMTRLRAQGKPIDAVSVSDLVPAEAAFVWSLSDHVTTVKAAAWHAGIVAKHALRRRLAVVGQKLASLDGEEPEQIAEEAQRLVDAVTAPRGVKTRFVRDVVPTVLERMKLEKVSSPSPWPTLDKVIGGFRPGAVYVVAARPGQGKTIVAGQIAVKLAEEGRVAFSSLEMTDEELVARMMSERMGIHVGRIKNANLNAEDWRRIEENRELVDGLQIAIDDRSGISAHDVRAFARTVSRGGKLAGVIVDYLQLMTARSKMDRHLQVAEFSRQLKILAKDMQVPVIALSQLNRNSERAIDAVPKLSDLRESGAIEQDADVVMLLRREGDYPNEELIIDVAKNRHGETREVRLHWDGPFSRVMEWSR